MSSAHRVYAERSPSLLKDDDSASIVSGLSSRMDVDKTLPAIPQEQEEVKQGWLKGLFGRMFG